MTQSPPPLPGFPVQSFNARAIRVVTGANMGDPIGAPDDCALGDVYRLKPEAQMKRMVLARGSAGGGPQLIAPGSAIGTPGDRVFPFGVLTLLAPDGERLTLVTLWHEASTTSFALPLSPMRPRVDYTLVEARADLGQTRLADVICVSFAAGTLVTLPAARPTPIEDLRPGDLVLTRDNGPQPVRWIGKATLRAVGSLAPIVIAAGTMGNLGDLVVSPHHRLFLYQRGPQRTGPGAELLVQAKHLVDNERIWQREGGYVDYYSLVFDRHEIIFAEGIPAESLMVSPETVSLLPDEMAEELAARFPGLRHSPHMAHEVGKTVVKTINRDDVWLEGRS